MNNKTRFVLRGLLDLSKDEFSELVKEHDRYKRLTLGGQVEFTESLKRFDVGPLSTAGICPCCGK